MHHMPYTMTAGVTLVQWGHLALKTEIKYQKFRRRRINWCFLEEQGYNVVSSTLFKTTKAPLLWKQKGKQQTPSIQNTSRWGISSLLIKWIIRKSLLTTALQGKCGLMSSLNHFKEHCSVKWETEPIHGDMHTFMKHQSPNDPLHWCVGTRQFMKNKFVWGQTSKKYVAAHTRHVRWKTPIVVDTGNRRPTSNPDIVETDDCWPTSNIKILSELVLLMTSSEECHWCVIVFLACFQNVVKSARVWIQVKVASLISLF